MRDPRSRGWLHAALLPPLILTATPAGAAPIAPTADEAARREVLARRLPNAVLLWSRDDQIHLMRFADWTPQRLTSGHQDSHPRWSPDGSQLIFCRAPGQVMRMAADLGGEELLVPDADLASWTRDGLAVVATLALDRHRVVRHDLATGDSSEIYCSLDPAYAGAAAFGDRVQLFPVELHPLGRYLLLHSQDRGGHTYAVDLQQRAYIENEAMAAGAGSPTWSLAGDAVLATAPGAAQSVQRSAFDFDSGALSPAAEIVSIAETCACERSDIQHPRVSNHPAWLVFDALIGDGPRANGGREVYVWEASAPPASALRVTFDTGVDCSPSLFVPAGECADADGDGYGDGDTCLGPDCDDGDPAVSPDADELCNGHDDDCDLLVDERWPLLGQPCNYGLGACRANGIYVCAPDGVGLACPVEPGQPAPEVCEGAVDEDCDGEVDNGCACRNDDTRSCYEGPADTEGVGVCTAGAQRCRDGAWAACVGQILPVAELCADGEDNDCDGAADGVDGDCPGAAVAADERLAGGACSAVARGARPAAALWLGTWIAVAHRRRRRWCPRRRVC